MKRSLLVGALGGLLALGAAAESVTAQAKKPAMGAPTPAVGQQASGPEAAPAVPTGELALGSVRLPRAVTADGKPLKAGTYTVRLTPQEAGPSVVGQTPTYERWAEFVQGSEVKGREVVSIVPKDDIGKIAHGDGPATGRAKVEMLKDNEFLRVWINRGGNHYLIHLVPSAS